MMKRSIRAIALLLVLILLSLSLFSCGDDEGEGGGSYSGKIVTLNVYNWGEYISDGSEGTLNVNELFEDYFNKNLSKKYGHGIEVNYTTYANNEEMYQKIKFGAGSYDIIVPSDYMIEMLIGDGLLLPLNYELIPNFENISEQFKGDKATYDPNNVYSVPYTYGMVGIIYNSALVDKSDVKDESWGLLWNSKYKGKLLQFNNPRDAFGTAMYYNNIDINSKDKADWDLALKSLLEQRPYIQAYVNDEIFNKMTTASAVAAPYYAGDFLTMAGKNEDLAFYYPNEGTNYFVDAMCVPKTSKNPELAMEYINFMLTEIPSVANAAYIGYASPNKLVYDSETGVYNEDYGEQMLEYHEDWEDILYGKSPSYMEEKYDYSPIYKSFDPEIQDHVNSLWESLKTENSTELWVHILSGVIVVGVVGFAGYTIYIRKKRSRHYRLRDKSKAAK